ncbi:hypothetical protein [Zhongshania sp.]|uniref:hypothetical protein n=1 Tax=Zhongshania sp. TaxID=1971902 RepID=UPI0039E3D183
MGQKKLLATVIDESGLQFSTVSISAGRRGLKLELINAGRICQSRLKSKRPNHGRYYRMNRERRYDWF